MKHIALIFLITILAAVGASAGSRPRTLEAALDSLDAALTRQEAIVARRFARVDSLKAKSSSSKREHLLEIAHAYGSLLTDSAIQYYSRALALPVAPSDATSQAKALIDYARQLTAISHFQEALAAIDTIDLRSLTEYEKMGYYDVRARLFLEELAFSADPATWRYRHTEARRSLDSLKALVIPYPGAERMVQSMIYTLEGDTIMAAGELSQAIEALQPGSTSYAVSCGLLANLYRNRPDKRREYLYYLALAATADAKNGNGEAYSLELLGSEILKENDFDRALNYISSASDAMRELGVAHRVSTDHPPMAIMLQTMRERETRRNRAFVTALSLLAFTIVVCAIFIVRMLRRDRANRRKYAAAIVSSEAKDRYINQLFEICSSYIDSIEDFNRLVSRKIKTNQVKDLYETIESGKIVKQQSERFYETFDRAVLNIYPDFVADINSLLLPDKKVELPEAGTLTPELRIAAFMRLGVTDSARIAKFLGLSLNTVYTYRNRLKTRAADRENFDNQLLKIG